jgi:hypothetical protein
MCGTQESGVGCAEQRVAQRGELWAAQDCVDDNAATVCEQLYGVGVECADGCGRWACRGGGGSCCY